MMHRMYMHICRYVCIKSLPGYVHTVCMKHNQVSLLGLSLISKTRLHMCKNISKSRESLQHPWSPAFRIRDAPVIVFSRVGCSYQPPRGSILCLHQAHSSYKSSCNLWRHFPFLLATGMRGDDSSHPTGLQPGPVACFGQ